MKKLFEPQSKPVSAVNATPKAVATHFLGISKLVQGTELPNVIGFYVMKKKKITEIYTHVSTKSLAKIKSPLDQFLETQSTNNQNNNNSLDKGYINITDV